MRGPGRQTEERKESSQDPPRQGKQWNLAEQVAHGEVVQPPRTSARLQNNVTSLGFAGKKPNEHNGHQPPSPWQRELDSIRNGDYGDGTIIISLRKGETICNVKHSLFEDSYSHPLHTCFPMIASN